MTAQIRSLTPRQVLDKINRAELQSELTISRQMRDTPSEGWRTAQVINSHRGLTGDRYLLDDGIPVLRVVHTPKQIKPSQRHTIECSFGDCQGDPAYGERCPGKPALKSVTASATAGRNARPNCDPGVCEGKATCADRQCHGHPDHKGSLTNQRNTDVEPAARALFWRCYLGGLAVVIGGIVYLVARFN